MKGHHQVVRAVLAAVFVAAGAASSSGCAVAPPRAGFAGGRIIIQEHFRGPITLVDGRTGERVNELGTDGWADLAPTDGQLVFLHGDGGLVARDIVTGEARWRVFTKVVYDARPVVTKKAVFVPLSMPTLLTDLPGDDRPTWAGFSKQTGEHILDLPSDSAAPLATNDDVLVTIEHNELVGYNAEDGKERWRSTLAQVKAPIIVAGPWLYARLGDAQVGSFNAASGALRQRISLGGTDAFGGGTQPKIASVGGSLAWIEGGSLHVADASTGKQIWSQPNVELMALSDTSAIICADKQVTSLELATGSKQWTLSLAASPRNIVANTDMVAIRVSSSELVVIDAGSGKVRFGFDLVHRSSNTPQQNAPQQSGATPGSVTPASAGTK